MESPVYCSWLEEERAEAEVNGKIENTRDIMRKYIARKFGEKSAILKRITASMGGYSFSLGCFGSLGKLK